MRVVLTGGGTGGHVAPQRAVLEAIRASCPDWAVSYLGSARGIEAKWLAGQVDFYHVPSGKLRRYFSWRTLWMPFQVLAGLVRSLWLLARLKPQVVFSTGGYVALPVCIAAWLWRIPLVIHEQTTVMGLANRLASRLATRVLMGFDPGFPLPSTWQVTGNPIRQILLTGEPGLARQKLGLDASLPVVSVLGGAQGSHAINTLLLEQLPEWLTWTQLVLITGDNTDYDNLEQAKALLPLERQGRLVLHRLLPELGDVYHASDLVVARAGAGTVSELIALAVPAVLIPLPLSAAGEQQANAAHMAHLGGAVVAEQAGLTGEQLLEKVKALFEEGRVAPMQQSLALVELRDAVGEVLQALESSARPE